MFLFLIKYIVLISSRTHHDDSCTIVSRVHHSDSSVEGSGFNVLLVVRLSSMMGAIFLLGAGVWHSRSSSVCCLTWPARSSWEMTCSTSAACSSPSVCRRSWSSWHWMKEMSRTLFSQGIKCVTRCSHLPPLEKIPASWQRTGLWKIWPMTKGPWRPLQSVRTLPVTKSNNSRDERRKKKTF